MRIERITTEGFPPFGDVEITLPEPESVPPTIGAKVLYSHGQPEPTGLYITRIRNDGTLDVARSPGGDPVITQCPIAKTKLEVGKVLVTGREKRAEVQLFTGPNGTGKSRVLTALASAAGNDRPLLSRLGLNEEWKFRSYQSLGSTSVETVINKFPGPIQVSHEKFLFGPIYAYAGSPFLTSKPIPVEQSEPANREEMLSFTRSPDYSAKLAGLLLDLKNDANHALAERIGGSKGKQPKSRAELILDTLERGLQEGLGLRSFAFKPINRPRRDIQVDYDGQTLAFHQLPDGLRVVIGWLADLAVMSDFQKEGDGCGNPLEREMIVLLDEPETHLHPGWQRKIIPLAQRLLPNAQLLVATHSPFVVMSVNEGWIHRLEPQADGTVKPLKPLKASPGDSYIHVMREVMNIPERFDDDSEKIMADFREAKNQALDGDGTAEARAKKLLGDLALRGEELAWIARAELSQFEEELKEPVPA